MNASTKRRVRAFKRFAHMVRGYTDPIKVTVSMNATVPQALALQAFFEQWNSLANAGSSRFVGFYVNRNSDIDIKFRAEKAFGGPTSKKVGLVSIYHDARSKTRGDSADELGVTYVYMVPKEHETAYAALISDLGKDGILKVFDKQ